MLERIKYGYKITFVCAGATVPPNVAHRNGGGCAEHEAWFRAALDDMVELGAVAAVATAPHGAASVDVIPKATPGKYRIIADLRQLNEHVHKTAFRYESLAPPRTMIEKGSWMFSLDLEPGYYHPNHQGTPSHPLPRRKATQKLDQ